MKIGYKLWSCQHIILSAVNSYHYKLELTNTTLESFGFIPSGFCYGNNYCSEFVQRQ